MGSPLPSLASASPSIDGTAWMTEPPHTFHSGIRWFYTFSAGREPDLGICWQLRPSVPLPGIQGGRFPLTCSPLSQGSPLLTHILTSPVVESISFWVATPGSRFCLRVQAGLQMNTLHTQNAIESLLRGFPGGTVVKNPPANAGGHGFKPCSGEIPHAAEQLSPCTTTTEPAL